MSVRRLSILAAAVAMLAAVAGPAGGTPPESEPNETRATADRFDAYPCYHPGSGSITPLMDLDYWFLKTPKHSQVWALVDPTGLETTQLRLENSAGALLEEDEDDGTATDGDALDSGDASVLAGVPIATGGTGFLQVSEDGSNATFDNYRLYAAVTKGHVPEVEPNANAAQANPVTRCPHVRAGEINPAGEQDWFAIVVNNPTTLFLALDADPGRTGGSDLLLDFISTDGLTPLVEADSSGAGSGAAEGFIFDVTFPSTYYVRVTHNSAVATGDYRLLVYGLPTVRCRARVATMTGSPEDDLIEGTDASDVISGLDGRDEIIGKRGKDRLCGGKKRDVIRGGRKKDRISGGRGGDILRGGRGDDRIKGNKGDDQMFGGRGDDICLGGAGSDSTNSC